VIRQTLKYYRQLDAEVPNLRTVVVSEPDALSAAKELHARTYLRVGIQPAEALTSDGHIGLAFDPYQAHAQYFSVQDFRDGRPRTVAAARVIFADPDSGLDSFPFFRERAPLYPRYRKLLAALDPAACGEISALVREPGANGKAALMLYRAVWHYALSQRYEYLLVLCKARLYRRCKVIFGKSWIRVGPSYDRLTNIREIPVVIDVRRSLDQALSLSRVNPVKRRIKLKALQFFLRGLPEDAILPAHRVKLDRYRLQTSASAPAAAGREHGDRLTAAIAPLRSLIRGRHS
jgi:hypothetical protein